MFLEYISFTGLNEFPTLSFEFISRVAILLLASVAMIAVGYKIKEGIGATIAILIILFFILYANGLLPV
ncbi:MAG: hypothetical protein JRJ41_11450 [Deltaproteobacteria bacterium]|jgi:hypothetical protein|nr:hypothetical protein [Deltaproteobacteria bacterium]